VVSVILDGENCWEHYAEDGRLFLEALYGKLESSPGVRTRTPSDLLSAGAPAARLTELHSGSWIDADFHIWIGHPEKNRAWEHVARARRALVSAGLTPASCPSAWESLYRAEGSDWYWWFGEDHYTSDKGLFDELFRGHLSGVYQAAGLVAPAALKVPVTRVHRGREAHSPPIAFVRPTVDGERTQFYEWHGAGRYRLEGRGGSMHRGEGLVREIYYGFDPERLYLRLDFVGPTPPGGAFDLVIELMEPVLISVAVRGLAPGSRDVTRSRGAAEARRLPESRCRIGTVLELAVPFADLDLKAGDRVEMLIQLLHQGHPSESYPTDEPIRFEVPDSGFEVEMWSV
jgi:hypothetical protein